MKMATIKETDDGGAAVIVNGHEVETYFSIAEAIEDARNCGLTVERTPLVIGSDLGGLAVEISEGRMDTEAIVQAIVHSTDPAWRDALRTLAAILDRAVDGY